MCQIDIFMVYYKLQQLPFFDTHHTAAEWSEVHFHVHQGTRTDQGRAQTSAAGEARVENGCSFPFWMPIRSDIGGCARHSAQTPVKRSA